MKAKRVVIIGGGIVGLATAYKLLSEKPETQLTVIEKEKSIGHHQTGHNSGVLHAGLYYAPGSLKAKLCVSGLQKMVEFCKTHNVAFETCGKVIVATEKNELPRLQTLYERAVANGLQGVKKIGPEELREYEPHAAGIQALHVPQTGIADYIGVCKALVKEIDSRGGSILTSTTVEGTKFVGGHWNIKTSNNVIQCDALINCAGLQSDRIAQLSGERRTARIVPFRGEYYELKPDRRFLVKNLIYPVPDPAFPFLGVHFTRMIGGGIECGPNAVLALKREGYKKTDFSTSDIFDMVTYPGFWRFTKKHWWLGMKELYRSLNKNEFCRSLQRLVPEVRAHDLVPVESGIRAQAMDSQGALLQDFHIMQAPQALHVLNTPSPAATASLAIGEAIVKRFLES